MFMDHRGNFWPAELIKSVWPTNDDKWTVTLKGGLELEGCDKQTVAASTIIPNANPALLSVDTMECQDGDVKTQKLFCQAIIAWSCANIEIQPEPLVSSGFVPTDAYVYDARLRTMSNHNVSSVPAQEIWPHHAEELEAISKRMGY